MSVRRYITRWPYGVALAALMIGAPLGVLADEADRPVVTPLDLAPINLDPTPAGALPKPESSSEAVASHLDLSPPPGFQIDLPPESDSAAPPTFADAPISRPIATEAAKPEAAKPEALAPVAAQPATISPEPPSAIAEAKPDLPTPAAVRPAEPTVTSPALSTPAASVAPVTSDAMHAALDAWLAKPAGRPIGRGDWEAARHAIASVYAERDYAPLWVENDSWGDRAKSVFAQLARADEDGLNPPLASGDASAQADVALSAAVVAYAMQASGARVNPRLLSKDVTAAPPVADPAAALKSVADGSDPGATLEAFNPPHPEYRALRAALADLRARNRAPSARLSNGPPLSLGMSDPRVPLIRARFGIGADPEAAQVYDVKVASAVAAFQRVHGLKVNGMLTAATADALAGASDPLKERRILANMEMWRWMPRDLGETRVEVNIPDFALKVTSGGEIVHRARVIVGKPDTPTPVFSNAIRNLLVNPAWHVPDSIIKKEMAPKLASDPDYFARHGYKVSYAGDKMVVEQPPGEANALGRILFLFPNEHAVYLHDTPQRYLFAQGFRALSHGCVRVEDPARLAELLMGGVRRGWSQDKIRSLLGDKERTYALAAPVPVHLEYFTEVVDEHGALASRPDLYGLTEKVISALQVVRRD